MVNSATTLRSKRTLRWVCPAGSATLSKRADGASAGQQGDRHIHARGLRPSERQLVGDALNNRPHRDSTQGADVGLRVHRETETATPLNRAAKSIRRRDGRRLRLR